MKRATKVNKTDRGEQDPFSKQLAMARKENARLRQECAERIEAVERKAGEEIDAACVARDGMMACAESHEDRMLLYERVHADFASVAPVLRSKSIIRRLWWGIRFGLWGVFGYDVETKLRSTCCKVETEPLGALLDGFMCRCTKCGREYME